jgi:two-component system CheB/CheR fusion protein
MTRQSSKVTVAKVRANKKPSVNRRPVAHAMSHVQTNPSGGRKLSRASDDMRNLLDSTDIATLFLDGALMVWRFTAQMTKLIKLIPGDVNRPITDLSSTLIYPELEADARSVLMTLASEEKPVRTLDGRWFSVRIMPYRTLDNRIDGVVITFVDITAAKDLEASLRQRQVTR